MKILCMVDVLTCYGSEQVDGSEWGLIGTRIAMEVGQDLV